MIKKFFIKEYIKFLNKTLVGKIINPVAKLLFGKIIFVTGFDQNGKEFYKIANSRSIDKVFKTLKEEGYSELDYHTDFDDAQNRLYDLLRTRISR